VRLRLMLALVFTLTGASVWAVQVTDLYQAVVTVENKSAAARRVAEQRAFLKVLVKVTGNPEVVRHPEIQKAVGQQYLKSFGYVSVDENQELQYQGIFSKSLIDDLLQSNGFAIWGSNRPELLFWVLVLNGGSQEVLSANAQGMSAWFTQRLSQAGLPSRLPLFDAQDQGAFPSRNISSLPRTVIHAASARYSPDAEVAVRLINLGGSWRVNGYLEHQNRIQNLDGVYTDLASAVDGLSVQVAAHLAKKYAVLATLTTVSESHQLVIDKIDSYADYQNLMAMLGRTPGIRQVTLESVTQDRVQISLELQVSWRQVLNNLALESSLKVTATPGVFSWGK
jgi:hypothetical protein